MYNSNINTEHYMFNPHSWKQRYDELEARGQDESLSLEQRVHALAQLFFHCGQDRHSAARAVRLIEDLTAPKIKPKLYTGDPMVSYRHRDGDAGVRFVQYAKDPVPIWAVDVQPFVEV